MNREVQNPTLLCQIFWKDVETNKVVSILEEVTFSDRSDLAPFIEKRLRHYLSFPNEPVRRPVIPSFRVYHLVRANFKI